MNIYVGHSRAYDYVTDLYRPIQHSRLMVKHQFIFPHEPSEGTVEKVTKEIIKSCDVFIAEVSAPSLGLGIELGWADIFERPIICLHRAGSKVSRSLAAINVTGLEYTNCNDLVQKLSIELENIKL